MLQRRQAENGVVVYVSPLLEDVGVPHGFTTRIGGVSAPPFDSLNLGQVSNCDSPDSDANIEANFRRLQEAIGCQGRSRCSVYQVHGREILRVECGQTWDRMQQADGMYTDDPARMLCVRVADCVPILMAAADGKIVAAVHAGWRGIIAGAIGNAIELICATFAGVGAEEITAAIGPCIGKDAFEVGPEVAGQFVDLFRHQAPLRRAGDGKAFVNLAQAARMQLVQAGVPVERIDTTNRCTFRDSEEFFSHRREKGITGRMAGVIACGR